MSAITWSVVSELCRVSDGESATHICEIWSEIWGSFLSNFGSPKNVKIMARFQTSSQLDGKYLWNATRYYQGKPALQSAITPTGAYGEQVFTRNTLDCDQSNYSSRIVLSHIPFEFGQTGISAI